jgi:hypothetical protein
VVAFKKERIFKKKRIQTDIVYFYVALVLEVFIKVYVYPDAYLQRGTYISIITAFRTTVNIKFSIKNYVLNWILNSVWQQQQDLTNHTTRKIYKFVGFYTWLV